MEEGLRGMLCPTQVICRLQMFEGLVMCPLAQEAQIIVLEGRETGGIEGCARWGLCAPTEGHNA